MSISSRDYMRLYMRRYRAEGRYHRARPRRKPIVRGHPPRVFMPLDVQRHGHCCFCGLRSLATVCGFCRSELEGRHHDTSDQSQIGGD